MVAALKYQLLMRVEQSPPGVDRIPAGLRGAISEHLRLEMLDLGYLLALPPPSHRG